MTLEELRIDLLSSVRNCANPSAVAQLLSEADLILTQSRVAGQVQEAFWQALDRDLEVVTQEASMIIERQGAVTLRSVIEVARAILPVYRRISLHQPKGIDAV
jgi:hypothetical protein